MKKRKIDIRAIRKMVKNGISEDLYSNPYEGARGKSRTKTHAVLTRLERQEVRALDGLLEEIDVKRSVFLRYALLKLMDEVEHVLEVGTKKYLDERDKKEK